MFGYNLNELYYYFGFAAFLLANLFNRCISKNKYKVTLEIPEGGRIELFSIPILFIIPIYLLLEYVGLILNLVFFVNMVALEITGLSQALGDANHNLHIDFAPLDSLITIICGIYIVIYLFEYILKRQKFIVEKSENE
ncbi:MAG: hypothetical protein SPI63_04850 [Bulleidia sp.]|nr:hypothetical protein [Bulleidia sp.]